jgi:hypothetical protein
LYGVGLIIDVKTGLVVDYEVLSKFCKACVIAQKRTMTPDERAEWEESHKPFCEKNFHGSSKAMEKEAAIRMWRRSVEKNNLQYTQMLSDGDSSAYKAVVDVAGYPVTKLECVNHVDKRMGTALRKKAKENKLGGRKYGALTVNACAVLQSYYRNAIMKNLGNSESMKRAIWATFHHCASTDESPKHEYCPDGEDSWCFFKKARASGQPTPPHKDNIRIPLSAEVAAAVKPIYQRMSDDRSGVLFVILC